MKRNIANANNSIMQTMIHVDSEMYTKQTLQSLFRSLLESIIEGRYEALVLFKVDEIQSVQGVLNRLKFSGAQTFMFAENFKIDGFNKVVINQDDFKNEDFLVIFADRFSVALCWNNTGADKGDLLQGFCSFNPVDTKKIFDYLQSVSGDESLISIFDLIRQDRRHNEHFTSIINKLLASLESSQRDLMCASAQEALPEVDSFDNTCSTIVHELRNPLGMIGLHAKIVNSAVDKVLTPSKQEDAISAIKRSSQSLLNAIDNMEALLADLKNYSSSIVLDKTSVSLKELLNDVIELILPVYSQKNISVSFECDSQIESLLLDKHKIQQIIINLLKNSFEATDNNGKVIVNASKDESLNKVLIRVTDSGSGIAPDVAEKIFLPLYTTKASGSGIGLAYSYKVAEAHGGELVLESTGKGGSTFLLSLPA